MIDDFTKAIHNKNLIRLTFFSKEDGTTLTRKCAPMDYAVSRKFHDGLVRYHFWDFESDKVNHNLPLLPDQIRKMQVLPENFDPATFIYWNTQENPWTIKRDWGRFS